MWDVSKKSSCNTEVFMAIGTSFLTLYCYRLVTGSFKFYNSGHYFFNSIIVGTIF